MDREVNLYHWRSEALKNYSQGNVLAIGTTPDEARDRVRKAWPKFAEERWAWCDSEDEDDLATIENYRLEFEADLAVEPCILSLKAIIIEGGE